MANSNNNNNTNTNSSNNSLEHNNNIDNDLKICLQKQIDEIQLLSSIFCNPGELKIDDHSIIVDINEFLDNKRKNLIRTLDFTICLNIKQTKLFIYIELPHLYPLKEKANITIRSTLFNQFKELQIKNNLYEFINKTVDNTEIYIYEVITWIQDNLNNFLLLSSDKSASSVSSQQNVTKCMEKNELVINLNNITNNNEFERIWIYSHHIKSKMKRQEILKTAKNLELTGFSRPGKPGIICLEGLKTNTQEFWKYIKSLQWQKISIKTYEEPNKDSSESNDLNLFRKFKIFEEIIGYSLDEDQPKNMSYFMRFLDEHNCNYIKKDLFGFD